MPLNPRQQKFLAHYLAGTSAAEAYRLAGYACGSPKSVGNSAARLLENAGIKAAVAAAAARAELTTEWVTRNLMAEATRTGDGASHAARVRALELLGRRFGLFAEQVEVSGPAGGPIDLRTLPDDDLRALRDIIARSAAPAAVAG